MATRRSLRASSDHSHSPNLSVILRAWAWAANVAFMSSVGPPVRSISALGRLTWMVAELHNDSSSSTASLWSVP